MNVVYGDGVVDWVDSKIPGNPGFDNPFGIGILNDGKLDCAVVFDNWRPATKSVFASIAIQKKTGLTREALHFFFGYGYNYIGAKRITCLIEAVNNESIELCSRLGFIREGILRHASQNNSDVFIYGMLKDECKWL